MRHHALPCDHRSSVMNGDGMRPMMRTQGDRMLTERMIVIHVQRFLFAMIAWMSAHHLCGARVVSACCHSRVQKTSVRDRKVAALPSMRGAKRYRTRGGVIKGLNERTFFKVLKIKEFFKRLRHFSA